MSNIEEVCGIKFESCYVERTVKECPITFRNMIYWRSFRDKIELFWSWLRNREGLTFNEFLDKPRELVYEWQYIKMGGEDEGIYVNIEPEGFDFKE